jgi:hypothetical protein
MSASYKLGTFGIRLARVWVGQVIDIPWCADPRAVNIVGVDMFALLVGLFDLEVGVLLYGCHGDWCLGVDWSTRV